MTHQWKTSRFDKGSSFFFTHTIRHHFNFKLISVGRGLNHEVLYAMDNNIYWKTWISHGFLRNGPKFTRIANGLQFGNSFCWCAEKPRPCPQTHSGFTFPPSRVRPLVYYISTAEHEQHRVSDLWQPFVRGTTVLTTVLHQPDQELDPLKTATASL